MPRKHLLPEIWGGIECTINRVDNEFFDQLQFNGHYNRPDDLDHLVSLGIKKIRYPLLWEKHQEIKNGPITWWADEQLQKLKENKIEVIAGLVHHGSGPAFTNLLDEEFPQLLSEYASQVAARYPWIQYYTPVNEPLTTARFSGLYGLWYPHKKNDVSYIKMLLNQLKATILSMQEIRKINPEAKLVQTEDLGKTYSTKLLSYQANFENLRRWLTYDILCGKFNQAHPLWNYFKRLGIKNEVLKFFTDNPCPPDIIGVNHYVTSERFIDEDLSKYPDHTHGGNTLHQYADVEAVRVKHEQPHGFKVLMHEIWERYNIPLAVTEVHLHCSRDEQLKWFKDIYDQCCELKKDGVQIQGITAWAMLGSFGWSRLLTGAPFEYEMGTFDISSGMVRPTAMASMLKSLIATGEYNNPVLNGPGWWKCPTRYFTQVKNKYTLMNHPLDNCQPLLIIGKRGTLGKAFSRICNLRSLNYILLSREDLDICNYNDIERVIEMYNPWAIINAAGYVRVDDAETDKTSCFRSNTRGAQLLATACRRYGIQYMTFSSDLVFDGSKGRPYVESDEVNPLNVYGQSKAMAEKLVTDIHPSSLIIRTSCFFGPWDEFNFISRLLADVEEGRVCTAPDDILISPTYVPHLVNAALDLLIDEEKGIWHLTNNEQVSWYDWAVQAVNQAGLPTELVQRGQKPYWTAPRPKMSSLNSEKGLFLPNLSIAMKAYFEERKILTV